MSMPMWMVRAVGLVGGVALATASFADSAVTHQRTFARVADGVYVIRHPGASDGFPQGNTTVVVGSKSVLVVDSAYLPSSAAEDIAQIRTLTPLPVRFLVNTHWHPDHVRGNQKYANAYEGLAIVATPDTSELMRRYEVENLRRRPARIAALRAQLASGKSAQGVPLRPTERAELRTATEGAAKVDAELRPPFQLIFPTLLFEQRIDIDLGGRVAEIHHSGPGDTLGDAWIYLPQEKILITGDLVVHPIPYFFSGYPKQHARTLRQLAAMDAQLIVPGHGEVLHDGKYLSEVADLIDSVTAAVEAEVARLGSLSAQLDTVRKAVDVAAYRRRFAGDDAANLDYFDQSIEGLIREAFEQAPK